MMRSTSLRDLYASFLGLDREKDPRFAAPFLPFVPDGYGSHAKRILYVGKATRGEYGKQRYQDEKNASMETRINERTNFAKDVFEKNIDRKGATFWGFANDISHAVDSKCDDLGNLAWTNLCKVGTQSGNPNGGQIEAQREDAITILRQEIIEFKPTILVFVSANFAKNIMLPAIGAPNDEEWLKSEKDIPDCGVNDVWWMPASPERAAMVWLRHPGYAPEKLRSFARDKIAELTGNK